MARWGSANTMRMRPPGSGSTVAAASRWLYRVLAVTGSGPDGSGIESQLTRSAVSSWLYRRLSAPSMTVFRYGSFPSTYSRPSAPPTPSPFRWPMV